MPNFEESVTSAMLKMGLRDAVVKFDQLGDGIGRSPKFIQPNLPAHRFRVRGRNELVDRLFKNGSSIKWLLSRTSLLRALVKVRRDLHVWASISHTDNAACAIVTSELALVGIGVDMEPADRQVSGSLKFRMESSAEVYETDPLELWCLLEACYKADPTEPKTGIFTYRYDAEYRFLSKLHVFRCASGIDEGFRWAIAACYPR